MSDVLNEQAAQACLEASLQDVARRENVGRFIADHRFLVVEQGVPLHRYASEQVSHWADLTAKVKAERSIKGDFFSPLPELHERLEDLSERLRAQVEQTGALQIEDVLEIEETLAYWQTARDDAREYYLGEV